MTHEPMYLVVGEDRKDVDDDGLVGIIEAVFAVLITVVLFQIGTGAGLLGIGAGLTVLSALAWRRAWTRRERRLRFLQTDGEGELVRLHPSDFWLDLLGGAMFTLPMIAFWETSLNHPSMLVSIVLGVGTAVSAGAVISSLREGLARLRLVVGRRDGGLPLTFQEHGEDLQAVGSPGKGHDADRRTLGSGEEE